MREISLFQFPEKIRELLLLQEKGAYIESYIKNDINLIKEFYKNLGGDTKEINVRNLKKAYLDEPTRKFKEDLEERIELAKRVVRRVKDKQ